MKHYESKIQSYCVEWFKISYPKLALNLFAVPNGGVRSKRTALILKREGVVSGVSDLILLVPNKNWHGLCIEMKYGANKQTANQKAFEKAVHQVGYKYVVIRSLDEFIDTITNYLDTKSKILSN